MLRADHLDAHCPHCGSKHGDITVDLNGYVVLWCSLSLKGYVIATEKPPERFLPEVVVQDDLPF
jgi:hypothetical protein